MIAACENGCNRTCEREPFGNGHPHNKEITINCIIHKVVLRRRMESLSWMMRFFKQHTQELRYLELEARKTVESGDTNEAVLDGGIAQRTGPPLQFIEGGSGEDMWLWAAKPGQPLAQSIQLSQAAVSFKLPASSEIVIRAMGASVDKGLLSSGSKDNDTILGEAQFVPAVGLHGLLSLPLTRENHVCGMVLLTVGLRSLYDGAKINYAYDDDTLVEIQPLPISPTGEGESGLISSTMVHGLSSLRQLESESTVFHGLAQEPTWRTDSEEVAEFTEDFQRMPLPSSRTSIPSPRRSAHGDGEAIVTLPPSYAASPRGNEPRTSFTAEEEPSFQQALSDALKPMGETQTGTMVPLADEDDEPISNGGRRRGYPRPTDYSSSTRNGRSRQTR